MRNDSSKLEKKFEEIVRMLFYGGGPVPDGAQAAAASDLGEWSKKFPEFRERAVAALTQALISNGNFPVRLNAAESLGKIGDAKAVGPLTKAMEDRASVVRITATQALGKIGKPAVEALMEGLKSSDEDVRMCAAVGLGKIRDVRAVKPLIEALRLKTRWRGAEGSAANALVEIGEPAVEPLIAVLKDSDENVRNLAIVSLGDIGDARAVEPLIAVLKDSDANVRNLAIVSLGDIGDARAVEPLIHALKDSNKKVRSFAAKTLKKIGGEKAEKHVRDYKKQTPWYKRL